MTDRQDDPATHQPTKEEMEEVIVIDATPQEIATAMLTGGAPRREPKRRRASETSAE